MPNIEMEHSDFPDGGTIRVGERGFYIHESGWDETPTLRQGLKQCGGTLYGRSRQSVYPSRGDHLGGSYIPLYEDPELARLRYIEDAQWKLRHRYTDPNRYGDEIGIKSVETNLNRFLRLKWTQAIQEARNSLREALLSVGWGNVAGIQEYEIGESVILPDGTTRTIALATLVNGPFDRKTGKDGQPSVIYTDDQGNTIDLPRKAG